MTNNEGDLLSSEGEADDVTFAVFAVDSSAGQYNMRPGPVATSRDSGEDILVCGQKLGLSAGNIKKGKLMPGPFVAEGDHLFIACNKAGAFRAEVEAA